MQASANIGRSLGGALASIGETIGTSLEKYRKNKEEDQFLTGQAEAIVPSLQAYAGDIKDDKQKASYEGLIKKLGDFSGQSLSQKRATLAQAGTFVQSFKNARDAQISAMQLNAAQQAVTNQDAYTQSLGGLTTQNVSREVPMSGLIDQSRYLYNAAQNQPPAIQSNFSNIDTEALSGMMNRGGAPTQAPASLPAPAQVAPSAIDRFGGQAVMARSARPPAPAQGISDLSAAPMENVQREDLTAAPMTAAERASALPTSPITAAPVLDFNKVPTSFNQNIGELPAQTSKRTVIDKVDLTPKELYTNQLTTYIAKGGKITPELNAQFKKDAGVFAPVDINVKQVTNSDGKVIATAVISNGKLEQLVLPEKPIGAQSEIGKKITDINNFIGQGNFGAAQLIADELKKDNKAKMTESQGKAYQYAAELFNTNKTISKLETDGFNPTNNTWDRFAPNFFKSNEGKQYYSAMDKWIEATLRDRSGAAISASEYDKARSQYFPNYGDSIDNIANKKELRNVAMQAMVDRAEGKMNDRYFGSTGENSKEQTLSDGRKIKIERF
jgi:hypothetical protein